jgi:hypothetical protein
VIWLAIAVASPLPAKLVIIPPGQPATVVDYPSIERCERARAVFVKAQAQAKEEGQRTADQTGRAVIVKTVVAYCIPS